jgi:PAS domain S-box-containing protein
MRETSPLKVLLRLAEQVARARGPEQRLGGVLDAAREAADACLAVVVRLEPEGPRVCAMRGEPREEDAALFCWLAARALELDRPLDLEEARRREPGTGPSGSPGALLAVPFPAAGGRARGALCVCVRPPRPFDDEEVELLRLVADRLEGALGPEPRSSEQRFEALFQNALDAILVADDSGRYVDANPAACEMLGMERSELLGHTIFELAGVPPEQTGVLWQRFLDEQVQKGEFELRRPDGRRVCVEYAARAHFVPGQHLSQLREVTRRKRAESLLALLTEASELLVGALEPEQVLRKVPDLAVKLLGDACVVGLWEEGELRHLLATRTGPGGEDWGRRPGGWRLPCSRMGAPWQALREGQAVLGRTTPEAASAWLEDPRVAEWVRELGPRAYLVVPLATRQRMLGVMALASTRPDWHYEEEDRVAALELARLSALALENARLHAQARQSLRLRQEMMAVVAHDLRNPLNALLLRALALERRAGTSGDAVVETDARALSRGVRLMESMLKDLVDLASIEAGRLSLERRSQPARGVLEEALEQLEPLARARGVALEARPAQEDFRVACDRARILQVLSNLVGNALKFTPAGGRVELGLERRGAEALFSVRDTGAGMSPEQLPHVFERYWRAEQAMKTAGLGLGLAIVKGIVEAHEGTVRVESQLGHGSTFSFTLPLVA